MLLAELSLHLLLRPETVDAAQLGGLEQALQESNPAERLQAVSVLAAAALQRPDLVGPGLVEAFLESVGDEVSAEEPLFEGLAACGLLDRNPASHILNIPRLSSQLAFFAILAGWRPNTITLRHLVQLAGRLDNPKDVARFLVTVLERWAWRAPDPGDDALRNELEAAIGEHPRWAFSRRLLERRRQTSKDLPPKTGSPSSTPLRILFVQNLKIGQGDEILRVGPLLTLLLAWDSSLRVELVSRRQHLYDHPRIRTTSIADQEAVRGLVAEAFDGFVWLDELFAPEIRTLSELPGILKRRSNDADLVIETATHHNHLIFRQLRIGGVDLLPRLLPARCAPHDAFECQQLLALLLGLPWLREAGKSDGPFVSQPSPEAESWLAELHEGSSRPLAVVQPFGGHAEIKGYTRGQLDLLAAELEALVGEGFRLVVLPSGTPWGSSSVVRNVFGLMAPELRRHCVAAPEPAETTDGLLERPELETADRVMRRFKYLLNAADLVVAVEGWACHLATLLNRPVRMVLWAGSFTPDWYPRGVIWCEGLSPDTPHQPVEFSTENPDTSVLPLARRGLLEVALNAATLNAARSPDDEAISLLLGLSSNPDPALRALASRAAVPLLEAPVLQAMAADALADPAAEVRAAAAGAWLTREDLRTDRTPSVLTLRAHQAIGDQNWPAVQAIGEAALPALAIAARGRADFIRHQARQLLRAMLSRRVRASGELDSPPAAS